MRKGSDFPARRQERFNGYAANWGAAPKPFNESSGGAKPPPHIKAAKPPDALTQNP
ncbi:MAG: hypothetical protein HY231_08515 [Acidobacteria bacterium]|nr:hypothetical protein [Acidobacteriota bacterium]